MRGSAGRAQQKGVREARPPPQHLSLHPQPCPLPLKPCPAHLGVRGAGGRRWGRGRRGAGLVRALQGELPPGPRLQPLLQLLQAQPQAENLPFHLAARQQPSVSGRRRTRRHGGPAARVPGASPVGRGRWGSSTYRLGSNSPDAPGCCCRARRYARSSASCASLSFLNLCGTTAATSESAGSAPGPRHPPGPAVHPRGGVPGWGRRTWSCSWGVGLPARIQPSKDSTWPGEKGLSPAPLQPPAAAPHSRCSPPFPLQPPPWSLPGPAACGSGPPASASTGCPGSGTAPGRWGSPPQVEGGKEEVGVIPPGLTVPELRENTRTR